MASIRKIINSPYWIASFTLPGGVRTNRSTKLTDRRAAQKLADEWESASRKADQGRFVEAQARSVLNDILAKVGEEQLTGDTVEVFLRRWLAGKSNAGTAKRYGYTVDALLEHLGPKRSTAVASISYQDVLKFLDARQQQNVAAKTLLADMRTLGAAFNLARRLGLVTSNPVERALALRPIEVEPSQRLAFTPEQVTALVGAAQGDWRTAVLIGFYSGARLSDCANLRWEDVKFGHGVIDYLPQKTARSQRRVVVPIHPTLRSHLESRSRNGALLCPSLAGTPTGGRNGLSQAFNRVMAAAGIIAPKGQLSFHSLRHGFNSCLANAGVPQETRMVLTGHRCAEVNSGYTHLDLPVLVAAVGKMPQLPEPAH